MSILITIDIMEDGYIGIVDHRHPREAPHRIIRSPDGDHYLVRDGLGWAPSSVVGEPTREEVADLIRCLLDAYRPELPDRLAVASPAGPGQERPLASSEGIDT